MRLDRRLRGERGGLDRGIVGLGGDFVDQALRVLVAARLQRRDGGDAIGARRLRIENDDRRARLTQGLGDLGVAFARKLRVERRPARRRRGT